MGTEFIHQAKPALRVAKSDQPLREQLNLDRRTIRPRQFLGHQGRNPVPAEQFSHRGPRSGADEELILLVRNHAEFSEPPSRSYRVLWGRRRRPPSSKNERSTTLSTDTFSPMSPRCQKKTRSFLRASTFTPPFGSTAKGVIEAKVSRSLISVDWVKIVMISSAVGPASFTPAMASL